MDFTYNRIKSYFQRFALAKIVTTILLVIAILSFVISTFFIDPEQSFRFPPAMILMGLAVLFQLRKGLP